MGLWNWLMPTIFSLHTITYWQALGLVDPGEDLLRRLSAAAPGGMRRHMKENWEHLTPRGAREVPRRDAEAVRHGRRAG